MWRNFRADYYSNSNSEKRYCFICGTTKNLNLHHISYKGDKISGTFGLVDPVNILILCEKCHKTAHKKRKSSNHFNWVLKELIEVIPEKVRKKIKLSKKEKQLLSWIKHRRKVNGLKLPDKWHS